MKGMPAGIELTGVNLKTPSIMDESALISIIKLGLLAASRRFSSVTMNGRQHVFHIFALNVLASDAFTVWFTLLFNSSVKSTFSFKQTSFVSDIKTSSR